MSHLLQQEGAEPPILALVVLQVVTRLRGRRGVLFHHVVVHEGGAAEQREAACDEIKIK